MKNVRRLVPLLVGLVGAAGGSSMTACGDDTTSSAPGDAAGDSGEGGGQSDALTEASPGMDASNDAPGDQTVEGQSDATADADATIPDGSMSDTSEAAAFDASDAAVFDASDSGAPDSSEASVADAAPDGLETTDAADAGLTAVNFPAEVAAAICERTAACCGTSGDAAAFNWAACYSAYLPVGFKGSGVGASLFEGGHIVFDAAHAQACINEITSVDCQTNQVTGPEFAQLFQNCFGAYTGTLAAGAPCAATIECGPGNFCLPEDGGVGDAGAIGVCQPLVGVGGSCGLAGNNLTVGETICSYRGAAANGLFCKIIDQDAPNDPLLPSEWTCQSQLGVDSGCWTEQDCTSYICHEYSSSDYQCAGAGDWANTSTCATYVIGGGG